MSALPPSDIDRFAKILGLLGSDQMGERASAAAKATEFLKERSLAWLDVGEWLKHPPVIYRPAPVAPSRAHQQDASRCLLSGLSWKPNEHRFLTEMASQLRRPSDKQRDWLDGLLDRVTRSRGRA